MYDHYIAIDWSERNMAIARLTRSGEKPKTIDVPADIKSLQLYLDELKGKKQICFEETTTSQWLYTELKEHCDEIVVCDPYRNYLLNEGAKNDTIDAEKLVLLLKANLLKPVFHTWDETFYLRKLVSAYEDVVRAGVRWKNQNAALLRAAGKKDASDLCHEHERFIAQGISEAIEKYHEEKNRYEAYFEQIRKQDARIRNLASIPGIATINAVKIVALVIEPRRFATKGRFLSYCGLIKYDKISGGRSYGKRSPRYSRTMKNVFKTAVAACIQDDARNAVKQYYDYLIVQKHYPEHNARHALSRHIAILAWGILKHGKRFNEKNWGCGKHQLTKENRNVGSP